MLDGDCPYEFDFKKLEGSNDAPNLLIEEFNPRPTFLKLGIRVSSLLFSPPPNINEVVPSVFIFLTNLRDVLTNFKILGTEFLNCDKSLSNCSVFG